MLRKYIYILSLNISLHGIHIYAALYDLKLNNFQIYD